MISVKRSKKENNTVWTEERINKNLFYAGAALSIIIMAMLFTAFISRGAFPPPSISLLYLGVLLIYAAHKELLRWLKDFSQPRRKGEFFVYAWIVFSTSLYVIDFLSKGKFTNEELGGSPLALTESSVLTLQVLAIFILTRVLKLFRKHVNKLP